MDLGSFTWLLPIYLFGFHLISLLCFTLAWVSLIKLIQWSIQVSRHDFVTQLVAHFRFQAPWRYKFAYASLTFFSFLRLRTFDIRNQQTIGSLNQENTYLYQFYNTVMITKLLTAIFGLSCIFVDLAAANPTVTGLTDSQGISRLSTERSTQEWQDINIPSNICSKPSLISIQPGIPAPNSSWTSILKDCQDLRSQANSRNGNDFITFDSLGTPVTVLSHGSCTLSVEIHLGRPDIIPAPVR